MKYRLVLWEVERCDETRWLPSEDGMPSHVGVHSIHDIREADEFGLSTITGLLNPGYCMRVLAEEFKKEDSKVTGLILMRHELDEKGNYTKSQCVCSYVLPAMEALRIIRARLDPTGQFRTDYRDKDLEIAMMSAREQMDHLISYEIGEGWMGSIENWARWTGYQLP